MRNKKCDVRRITYRSSFITSQFALLISNFSFIVKHNVRVWISHSRFFDQTTFSAYHPFNQITFWTSSFCCQTAFPATCPIRLNNFFDHITCSTERHFRPHELFGQIARSVKLLFRSNDLFGRTTFSAVRQVRHGGGNMKINVFIVLKKWRRINNACALIRKCRTATLHSHWMSLNPGLLFYTSMQ